MRVVKVSETFSVTLPFNFALKQRILKTPSLHSCMPGARFPALYSVASSKPWPTLLPSLLETNWCAIVGVAATASTHVAAARLTTNLTYLIVSPSPPVLASPWRLGSIHPASWSIHRRPTHGPQAAATDHLRH